MDIASAPASGVTLRLKTRKPGINKDESELNRTSSLDAQSIHVSSVSFAEESKPVEAMAHIVAQSSMHGSGKIDDADIAAGQRHSYTAPPAPYSLQAPLSMGGMSTHPSDLEFFDDLVSEPVLVLGVDISHLNRQLQFIICATGVFGFSLLYGLLQELISVRICNRQLGLFLAVMQFAGYTILSFILRTYVYETHQKKHMKQNEASGKVMDIGGSIIAVPFIMYLGISLLRAVDLAMTNLAMQYINYPAKTLMKSSRVVFTMIFGVFIARKKYQLYDYFVVLCMVVGLAIFMHADATSSAVFQPLGVIMLTVSLLCDGAITNMSESVMKNYGVGQDEFIFRMYSIALVAITAAAAAKGDLQLGMIWLMQPGTYDEMQQGVSAEEATWSVTGKIMVIVLFSSMGFFGSSCSAAITKNFGALTMSITSTARKASGLFLSFFLFNNVCTMEHIFGVVIFIAALTAKSLRRRKDSYNRSGLRQGPRSGNSAEIDLEMQMLLHQDRLKRNSQSPGRQGRKSTSPQHKNGTPGRRPNASKGIVLGDKSSALVIL